ncbi:hypothetical protein THAOC_26933 [Thalassiosira oceanica]|uniref:Uncharacterized protein n=1 Tax=Thalassiosira oceanica TaxID=159749 RepID=K0RK60_THAOC|nr:hypothetical protein THAOC_26933 [Thalassiosira oceanica]|eukprot:EJK53600.1 hypothetical protein THAOC_26933 [Thalassiosira oceanica]
MPARARPLTLPRPRRVIAVLPVVERPEDDDQEWGRALPGRRDGEDGEDDPALGSLRRRPDCPPGATGGTTAETPTSSPSANGAATGCESKGAKRERIADSGGTQSSRSMIAWSHSSSNSRQLGRVSARTMRGIRWDDRARGTEARLELDRAGGL